MKNDKTYFLFLRWAGERQKTGMEMATGDNSPSEAIDTAAMRGWTTKDLVTLLHEACTPGEQVAPEAIAEAIKLLGERVEGCAPEERKTIQYWIGRAAETFKDYLVVDVEHFKVQQKTNGAAGQVLPSQEVFRLVKTAIENSGLSRELADDLAKTARIIAKKFAPNSIPEFIAAINTARKQINERICSEEIFRLNETPDKALERHGMLAAFVRQAFPQEAGAQANGNSTVKLGRIAKANGAKAPESAEPGIELAPVAEEPVSEFEDYSSPPDFVIVHDEKPVGKPAGRPSLEEVKRMEAEPPDAREADGRVKDGGEVEAFAKKVDALLEGKKVFRLTREMVGKVIRQGKITNFDSLRSALVKKLEASPGDEDTAARVRQVCNALQKDKF